MAAVSAMEDGVVQLVITRMEEVQSKRSALELVQEPDGELRVWGRVGFTIEHDGNTVTDDYQIELHIPDSYPESPPTAYEPEGKVPESFHKYPQSLSLCLGASVEVRRKFVQHKKSAVVHRQPSHLRLSVRVQLQAGRPQVVVVAVS